MQPTTTMTQQKAFLSGGDLGARQPSNGSRVTMKNATPKKLVTKPRAAPKKVVKKKEEGLWLPGAERPPWLDGSMPGDRGYDPLGLAKPVTYLQFDLDQQDQNAPKNVKGKVLGTYKSSTDKVSEEQLQPYSEVFGIQRFRECELLHGRWSMLAVTGAFIGELFTGVPWHQAGKEVIDNGAVYFNFELPFTIPQLTVLEVLLVGTAEIYRNSELDSVKRCYPGGYFDPLGLASASPDEVFERKEAELINGRIAMIAFLGFSAQALYTNEGPIGSLGKFYDAFYR